MTSIGNDLDIFGGRVTLELLLELTCRDTELEFVLKSKGNVVKESHYEFWRDKARESSSGAMEMVVLEYLAVERYDNSCKAI